MIDTILKKLGHYIFAAAVDYAKAHPDEAEAAITKVAGIIVDKLTDVLPGQWDDKALDGLAAKIVPQIIGGIRKFIGI
ncbi:hypothetical protein [Mycolicibacterium fortuitum]|uniref:hypothetical protein n=1 Tax=Mycolicibacterium fortuitum TaxID=1766 RepID=UPI0026043B6B|nr:hypothetical protein [Mycolicibacterium fortuitum]